MFVTRLTKQAGKNRPRAEAVNKICQKKMKSETESKAADGGTDGKAGYQQRANGNKITQGVRKHSK